MSFTFRKAIRESVPLLIGLAGGTGSGKTYTALRLASGIAGDKQFCVIDTEAGRAKHYADQFSFDHGDLKPPFRPDNYIEAIMAADKAGYPVIVVDSMSHSWAGEGGMLDWQEEELDRMAGDNWEKREKCKMSAWIKPKHSHKQMVNKLLQVRAHVILCFRAEPKVEMVKEGGKTVIKAKQSLTGLDGWIPISDKNLPFELTASFLLMANKPGIPLPIKLQQQHKALFPLDREITEESGKRLAEWASGTSAKAVDHTDELRKLLTEANIPEADFLKAGSKSDLSQVNDIGKAKTWIDKNKRATANAASVEGEKTGNPDADAQKTGEVRQYIDVATMLTNAVSMETLEVASQFIQLVPGATDQQRLTNLYASREAEFKERPPQDV